jgi:hypothetical protein
MKNPAGFLPRSFSRFCLGVTSLAVALAPLARAQDAAEIAQEGDEVPILKAGPEVKPIGLKRQKNSIGSALFVQGLSGPVGQFTVITGEATPLTPNAPGEVAYPRFLGPLTMKGLESTMNSVKALHGGWPGAQRITITFSEKVTPVELGPANLPCALLIDSMIRDFDIDPTYAVVGMLLPDGSIDEVGSIPGRMDGAARARVARLAVPEKNQTEVADYLMSAGITSFVGTQVFTVNHYNEAGKLALKTLPPEIAEAVNLYGSVQRTLGAIGTGRAVEMLRDARVQGTLEKVLAAAPAHLSARVLLEWGTGKRTHISLGGSMDAIDRYAPTMIRAYRAPNNEAVKLPKEKITQEAAVLRVLRERVDPKVRTYADALYRFGEALQKSQAPGGNSKANQTLMDTAREQARVQWQEVVRLRQTEPSAQE